MLIAAALAILIHVGPVVLRAASIVGYDVASRADNQRPGDRITATVLLEEGETDLRLEARPLVVSGRQFRPVPRKGQGGKSVAVSVRIDPARAKRGERGAAVVTVAIEVGYDHFELKAARYDFMYELRLLRGDRTLGMQSTGTSRLIVEGGTAPSIKRVTVGGPPLVVEDQPGKAYAVRNGKLVEFDATYEVARPAKGVKTRSFAPPSAGEVERNLDDTTRAPVASLAEFEPKQKRVVYYATNRNVVDAEAATVARFGGEISDTTSYGSCLVNIPIQNHQPGELTTRQYFWQFADPNKFFDVEVVKVLAKDVFQDSVRQGEVLLFIHGYYNSFFDAVLRVAQLQHDLQFDGSAVAFCWPSAASVTGYRSDEVANEKSLNSFVELLHLLIEQLPPERRIHVIAHSMGNRLLLHGVRKLEIEKRLAADARPFGTVVLAAPDVPANAFSYLAPRIVAHAARVTYYFATNDLALGASRMNHFDAPAGLRFFYIDGMETIDATHAGVESTNHGYYSASPKLLSDLRLAMIMGFAAEKRKPPLSAQLLMEGFPYWAFPNPLRAGGTQ